ncbi:hypothetical protein AN214_03528 [Pseudoalteromonas sp. P1-9]|uniref:hypothetical protein n=1 Tax=Pseudoalteromonas sp. P1-9 TaxID=1710354 RepID=UPI0006D5E71A|nr:hypothetical protein [Pseudoalteromonas sp. P1-9]KPV94430.1 hypothetical protein AN214_03528 [Pseudoalteromonas sp. P1-9]
MDSAVIKSELDLLKLVESVFKGEKEAPGKLQFDGWPIIDINVKGERYKSSLPTGMMEGLINFQNELSRAYATVKYNTANLQKLTNEDRSALELIFTIKEGSTDSKGNAHDWLNGIFDKIGVVLEGMTGKEKLALYSVIALSVAGYFTYSQYSDSQTKIALEKEQTKQMEVVSKAAKENPLTRLRDELEPEIRHLAGETGERVIRHIDTGYTEVVRTVQDATAVSIGEKSYDKDDIKRIVSIKEPIKDVLEEKGSFTIEGIKKNLDYLIVNVVNHSEDLAFSIKVDLSFTPKTELDTLYDALRDGNQLEISYQAHYRDGEIVRARLIKLLQPIANSV